ncbi:hypothetical protein Trydic_g4202 [Trypoxylus dichotomus]
MEKQEVLMRAKKKSKKNSKAITTQMNQKLGLNVADTSLDTKYVLSDYYVNRYLLRPRRKRVKFNDESRFYIYDSVSNMDEIGDIS